MTLLLDTHVVIAVLEVDLDRRDRDAAAVERAEPGPRFVSVASLWELAIKVRLGKLSVPIAFEFIEGFLVSSGFTILPVTAAHAIAEVAPVPPTRDPFDRLLLAQAQMEGARLVTWDRALAGHPLAAPRAASS